MSRLHLKSTLEHVAAEYVNRESNRLSLITVTRVELDERNRTGTVFVSVFPDTRAAQAVEFLKRSEREFEAFVRTRIKAHGIPRLTFQQDPNIAGVENVQ